MLKRIKSKLWKTAPCEEAIAEADEILAQLAWLGGILLAVVPTVIRIWRSI